MLVAAQNVSDYDRTHVEVAGAIEAVMRDTSWFTDAVMEKLAQQASNGATAAASTFAGLGELPPRGREILTLVCQGLDDPAIAAKLSLSANTVRNHIASLFRKTGVRTRAQLIVWGRERNVTGRRIAKGSAKA